MASPTKGELFLGLSSSELKLICLGVLYNDAGKVDYEKVAEKGGYTKGSAQVLYRKALRKLMDYENGRAGNETTNENNDAEPSTPVTPAKQKGAAGRKRKADALTAESDDTAAVAATAGTEDTPTKPKRQRKTPAQKATTGNGNGNGKNGNGVRVKKEDDAEEANTPTNAPTNVTAQLNEAVTIKNEPDDDDDAATIKNEPEDDDDATIVLADKTE